MIKETQKTPRIALVAHNSMKGGIVEFAKQFAPQLHRCELSGTASTAQLVSAESGLEVEGFAHGPDGGDIQVANRVILRQMDGVIFFEDTEADHEHQHDIDALKRICRLYSIPVASNSFEASDLLLQLGA